LQKKNYEKNKKLGKKRRSAVRKGIVVWRGAVQRCKYDEWSANSGSSAPGGLLCAEGGGEKRELHCSPCIAAPRDTRTDDFASPRKLYEYKPDDESSREQINNGM